MKACFNGKRAQAFECKNYNVCQASDMLPAKLNQLPAFLLGRTAKQTARCQTVGDRLRKHVRLFQYSDWLRRKSISNLAIQIYADLRHMRPREFGISKKLTHFGVLMTKEHLDQFS